MGDILWENEITDRDEINSRYMFHRAKKNKVRGILANGFKPKNASKDEKKDERFLKKVAEVEGARLPVDRTVSSFFYPHYSQVDGSFGGHLGTALVVVDSSKVSVPMYVADMDLYDSVISYSPLEDKEIQLGTFDNEQTVVALAYLETVQSIERVTDTTGGSLVQPEVIVEGIVNNSSIVGVVLDGFD